MDWLRQVLDGAPDAATVEHICRGFNTWLKSGTRGRIGKDGRRQRVKPMSPMRFLGLPDNPDLVRIALRNAYLCEAGELLQRSLPITKSVPVALEREVQHFVNHRWLCWMDMTAPPPHAAELDRLLFLAMRAGAGRLPGSARQYATILKS